MSGLKKAGSVATVTRCPARHEGRNSCPAITQSQMYCRWRKNDALGESHLLARYDSIE
jgi:hypothetical protein